MEFLVGAVEGDDNQSAVNAFYLAGAEGFVGDNGAGADVGGIHGHLGLCGRGRDARLGRDIGGPICIADCGVPFVKDNLIRRDSIF